MIGIKRIKAGDRVTLNETGVLFHDWTDYREGEVKKRVGKEEDGTLTLVVEWDDGNVTFDNEHTVRKCFKEELK